MLADCLRRAKGIAAGRRRPRRPCCPPPRPTAPCRRPSLLSAGGGVSTSPRPGMPCALGMPGNVGARWPRRLAGWWALIEADLRKRLWPGA